MLNKTDDLRIINTQELLSPSDVIRELSPSELGIKTILESRREIGQILNKKIKEIYDFCRPMFNSRY